MNVEQPLKTALYHRSFCNRSFSCD